MIELSNIEILPVEPNKGLLAFASFTLNTDVQLSSIAIHSRLNGDGYRLTYPIKNGRYLFYPTNRNTSKLIESLLIGEFKNVIKQNDRHGGTLNT